MRRFVDDLLLPILETDDDVDGHPLAPVGPGPLVEAGQMHYPVVRLEASLTHRVCNDDAVMIRPKPHCQVLTLCIFRSRITYLC